jgi:HD superfamily phosphohydrolase
VPSKEVSPIKDIVHGYIDISPLEKIVIDSRQFQRLHFVLQNSSTYTAYPTNKNSRFAHSLGVAHVAGAMFQNAMKNASAATLHQALHAMANFIERYYGAATKSAEELREQWLRCVGYQIPFQLKTDTFVSQGAEWDRQRSVYDAYGAPFLVNTFGAAIRVCGLVHDIGHLPMSHIFESALGGVQILFDRYMDTDEVRKAYSTSYDKFQHVLTPGRGITGAKHDAICSAIGVTQAELNRLIENLPVHEKLSLQMFNEISSDVTTGQDDDKDYVNLVFFIALVILLSNKELKEIGASGEIKPLLRGLRDIISSELDADRIDYTLRDPIESGVTDRQFDLSRLLSEMTLHYDENARRFTVCCGYKALSVVETVFHNRFINYRFIIYHHSVVRMNCVLEEVIRQLIRICFVDPKDDISRLLGDFGLVRIDHAVNPPSIELFPDFKHRIIDESWLRSLLISVTRIIEGKGSVQYRYLVQLIDTFLFRKTDNLKTMWKSEMDFARVRRNWKDRFPGYPTTISSDEKIALVECITVWSRKFKNDFFIFFTSMNPKVYKPGDNGIRIIDSNGELWEAAEVSPYLRSLKAIADEAANFHVSFMAVGLKSKENDWLKTCSDVEDSIIEVIANARRIPPIADQ